MFVLLALSLTAPIPKGDPEGTILLVKSNPNPTELILMKSGGTVIKRFEPKGIEGRANAVRLNPTCSQAIIITSMPIQAAAAADRHYPHNHLYLIDLTQPEKPVRKLADDLHSCARITWFPDGKKIVFSDVDEKEANAVMAENPVPYRIWTMNVESKKRELLKIPSCHNVRDISDDGKTLLSLISPYIRNSHDYEKTKTYLVPIDTLKPVLVPDLAIIPNRLSKDGKAIIGTRYSYHPEQDRDRFKNIIYDMATKSESTLREPEGLYSSLIAPVWTGVGRGAAYLWYERTDDPLNGSSIRYNLSVVARRDEQPKRIFQGGPHESISAFDWR